MSTHAEPDTAAAPRATGARHPSFGRSEIIQTGVFAVTVLLVIGPLLPVLYQSLVDRPLYADGQSLTLANCTNIAADPDFLEVVANSLVFAALSTVIAQVIGVVLAVLIGRTDMPGRRVVSSVVLWPLFLSPLLLSMGWFILYGPAGYVTQAVSFVTGASFWNLYTIAGMSVVAGVAQAPVTVLYCLASASLADARMEDAARSCGAGPWRTLRHVTLPMLLPAIMISAVLNFMNALESLSIPFIFGQPAGIRMFMTYIYEEFFLGLVPDYGLIGAAAVILLVIIALLIKLQKAMLGDVRRFNSVGGKASRSRLLPLGGLRWPAFALAAAYLVVAVVLPLGAVVLRACVPFLSPLVPIRDMIGLDNFREVFASTSALRAISNTVLISLLAATLGTVLAALVSLVSTRSSFRYRRLLEYIALFPRAVPGMIAGVGFLYLLMFVPMIGWMRNSIWIIVLAYASRALPSAIGAIGPSITKISPDLDRAARVVGADWWMSMRIVMFRLIAPALFASFALLFISFTKEYSTAIFLVAPGSEVLGVSILQSWNQGAAGVASALATIQIGLLALFLFIARRVLRVNIHG